MTLRVAGSDSVIQMLPISVLVPTRNSMSLLPQHIESMSAWSDLVQEIVAVDSHSNDGTLERLQAEFGSIGRVLTHPPGLYQSWNFGISQCRAKYVYIATVGDPISRAGIEKLFSAAEGLKADIVVSPPRMVDLTGKDVNKTWPIHSLIENFALREPVALDGSAAQLFATAHLLRGILGSSASNLYRTELLQGLPFRTDFGTAGDLAWGLENALKVRLAVVPEQVSSFVFHPKSYAKSDYAVDDFARRCLELAGKSALLEQTHSALIGELLAAWQRFLAAKAAVAGAKRGAVWFVRPSAWQAHADRSAAQRELASLQNKALRSLLPGLIRGDGST